MDNYLCSLNLALSENSGLVWVETSIVLQRSRNGLRSGLSLLTRHTIAMETLCIRVLCLAEPHAHNLTSCFIQEIPRIFLVLFKRR